MDPQQFIARIAPMAVLSMYQTGIPASLTIAQAALESSWGSSSLTVKQNNLFGIKGGNSSWTTTEYGPDGKPYTIKASFRAYASWQESIDDHAKLLLNGTRDNPTRYRKVVDADYRTAAQAVYQGGYATDPNYPKLLIQLIEQYHLYVYDATSTEEENTLNLTTNQQTMLVTAIDDLIKKGYITDPSWLDKAKKGELTLSELTWLNTIVLTRLK
ncbi:glycoside hydrolase family 73 protein [Paenibacillus guangzhouensis]|uniref:glycoside hydrolase family 73 protein n=1 Tax=Paenibacillus guangzhouensis TaxID=1473112 RepID=UPI0012670E9F|nr:glycoside hydrolase family 73 protein [Paenibacillus guangzhouensis]